jgi:hypothetical protein
MLDLIGWFHQEEKYFCLQSEGLSHVAHHKKNYDMLTIWYRMARFCELKSAFKN